MLRKSLIVAAAAVAALSLSLGAQAHEGHVDAATGKEVLGMLQHLPLPDAPGKHGVLVTVTYAPGQASIPHRHPGSVFAYVLEGEVESQLADGKPVTYKAGDSWYEAPLIVHGMSRNASATKPAKLLVYMMLGEGDPPLIPLSK
ncbi:cupin domain-containing protein [Pseudoduganella aquatica]|uniref:Cupin domain-containing protein n=1 Tax=Pseudoduganella aquatica TaxID=2660641 RepID=A0A7X4H8P2_9BURK|nr:cupin domain-containing protein [Pseudoduganella aquatica]MYN06323.1 cupin domain-containing protein [Pseudoduganella aquatica]